MMRNKLLIIFIFTIFIGGFIFSVPVVKINDSLLTYTNSASSNYFVEVSETGDDCEVESDFINITISSNATPGYTFPIYCNLSRNYSGYFSINFTSNNPTPPVPSIFVNNQDTVVLEYTGISANLMVDTINTILGTFNLTSLDSNVGNYFKGDANITDISSFSDAYSGLKSYYAYIVPFASLDTYRTNYTKRIIVDSDSTTINLSLLSEVNDGNYYVILDALDNAGNLGLEETAKNNKKTLLVDNTAPQVTNFNLGTFTDGATYYASSTTNIISLSLEDLGIGIRNEPLFTQLDRNDVKLADYNATSGGFYFDFTTVEYDINGSYELAATDLLGNLNEKTFNVIIDETAPSIPTIPTTVTRAIDNNITIGSWGTSTDSGSGVKEYKVYRSSSSFTTVTNQTLICTVLSSGTKTCVDTSSKSDNTRYYYGVSAIDHAGNQSGVIPVNIKTGPSLTIEIDSNYSNYVNKTTPKINLTYSSDVNATRFSCNGSTFSSWIDVSGTSFSYESFNITSGNGCSTAQGDKTIYVEVRSEDDPYPITRESTNIKYDTVAPTVPSNVTAVAQSNGSIKLNWNSSSDVNGSGLKEYRIYYSDLDDVSKESVYLVSTNTEYTFRPNIDNKFYFKLTSIDKIGNESALSAGVFADAKRFGPSFTFNVNPKNIIDDIIYLKKGIANFSITSSQSLKSNPTVRLKIGNNSFQNITITFANLIATFNYDFQQNGDGIIEVTGTNNANETSTDSFEFIIDVNAPVFDVNKSFDEDTNNFTFILDDYSPDVFRAQYLLNNTEEICFIEDSNNNYECLFDSTTYSDGDYKMHVIVYDLALNYTTEIVDFEIDNVDEQLLLKANLIDDVEKNKKEIDDRISFLDAISFDLSDDILDKFNVAKEKLELAIISDENNNFSEAVNNYTLTNNSLLEILTLLPEEKLLKTKEYSINIKNNKRDLTQIILDQNILEENLLFYDVNNTSLEDIIITREFSVFEISGQNYYSATITIDNNSSENKVVSYIEFIPKEFSKSAKNIFFDENVIVIDDDPIILYNISLSKNSSFSTRYINKEPVTSFDILTKFEGILYPEPLLLIGFLDKEDVNLASPFFETKLLFTIAVIFLIIIIVLLVIWVIISSHRKKKEVFDNLDAKDSINKYLGDKIDNSTLEKISDANSSDKSDIEKKAEFNNNYDYILNAVKREK